jgi:hypothetical protein
VVSFKKDFSLGRMGIEDRRAILGALMESKYTEDKLATILSLQISVKREEALFNLGMISDRFDKRQIYDLNVCGWLCEIYLTPFLNNRFI